MCSYLLQGHGVYAKALGAAKREAQAALQETTEVMGPPCLACVRTYVRTNLYVNVTVVVFDQGLYTMSPIII